MGFVAPLIVGYIINDNNDIRHWQVDGRPRMIRSSTCKLGSLLDSV